MTIPRRYHSGIALAVALTFGVATLSAIAGLVSAADSAPSLKTGFQAFFDNYLASLAILAFIPVIIAGHSRIGVTPQPKLAFVIAVPVTAIVFGVVHIAWTLLVYRASDLVFLTSRSISPGPAVIELAREVVLFALLVAAVLGPSSFVPVRGTGRVIVVRDNGVDRRIPPAEIRQVQASRNYVVISHARGEITARATLADIEKQLPEGEFLKANRSTIIRIDDIVELRRDGDRDRAVLMQTGETIRLRRGLESVVRPLLRSSCDC